MKLAAPEFSLDESFERRLFTRRSDLTEAIRLTIANNALHAMLNNSWGTITELSKAYGISRTFVYSLAKNLKSLGQFIFSDQTESTVTLTQERRWAIEVMLSIRLEGCSSLGSVSTIMKDRHVTCLPLGLLARFYRGLAACYP